MILLDNSSGFPRFQFDGGGGRKRRNIIGNNEVNYLMKFGYLPQSTLETGALVTRDQLNNDISNLQKFGGLEVTGEINKQTLELMGKKRCGVHDVPSGFRNRKKRYALQGEHWRTLNLTWSVGRLPDHTYLDRRKVIHELHLALSLWSRYSNLKFTFLHNDKEGDIKISFHKGYHGDGYPFDGQGSVLAHAFFPGTGRGGDAHFDADENWSFGESDTEDQTNLFPVALHEFGHS